MAIIKMNTKEDKATINLSKALKRDSKSDPAMVGQRLQIVLEQIGMSKAEFARELKITASSVSQWLRGLNLPSKAKLPKIIKILDCDPNWLMFGLGKAPEKAEKALEEKEFGVFETGTRLKHLMEVYGFKSTELANELGVSRATVSQWVNDIAIPNGMSLVGVCETLNCTPRWLLSGRKWPSDDVAPQSHKVNSNKTVNTQDCVELPLFDVGNLESIYLESKSSLEYFKTQLRQQDVTRQLFFNKSTLDKLNSNLDELLCLKLNMPSMQPLFTEDTTIGVDTGKTEVIDDKLYAFFHYHTLRVAHLFRLPNGTLRITHENSKKYADEIISNDEIKKIVIIGRLFWFSVII